MMLLCRTIAEVAGVDEKDILYFSPSNQALAHLPYCIALDKCAFWKYPPFFALTLNLKPYIFVNRWYICIRTLPDRNPNLDLFLWMLLCSCMHYVILHASPCCSLRMQA